MLETNPHRRAWLATALFAVLALPLLCAAQGSYPSRPIVMIVPQAAGGTNDIVGRLVSQKLGEVMPASVVVENRPGAGGNIGTQAVARAGSYSSRYDTTFAGTMTRILRSPNSTTSSIERPRGRTMSRPRRGRRQQIRNGSANGSRMTCCCSAIRR